MPTAVFEDSDLIDAIANATGMRPTVIVSKRVNNNDKIEVFWK